jgi:hypothetical protein|tara:strand:- start:98 stop:388 length:291 start_codon:yes stop_codon:yes gene_type:complete
MYAAGQFELDTNGKVIGFVVDPGMIRGSQPSAPVSVVRSRCTLCASAVMSEVVRCETAVTVACWSSWKYCVSSPNANVAASTIAAGRERRRGRRKE